MNQLKPDLYMYMCLFVGAALGWVSLPLGDPKEVTMGRETGEREEKEYTQREEEWRRRKGENKMSGLCSKEPLGEGQLSPGLESSGLWAGYAR